MGYFDEWLERIREIRASEKRFYQKVRDIYATAIDYDSKSDEAQLFFKKVQNKMLWATTHRTAIALAAIASSQIVPCSPFRSVFSPPARESSVAFFSSAIALARVYKLAIGARRNLLIHNDLNIFRMPKRVIHHDLDFFFGTWSEKESKEFEKNVEIFERIDMELWR